MQLPADTATRLPGFDLTKSEAVVETIIYSPNSSRSGTKKSKNRQLLGKFIKWPATYQDIGQRNGLQADYNRELRGNSEAIRGNIQISGTIIIL